MKRTLAGSVVALAAKDGCLYIAPPGGPAVLPVFRPEAVPTEAVGDEVVLGGGFAPKAAIDSLREQFDIPGSCGTEAGIFLAAVQEH